MQNPPKILLIGGGQAGGQALRRLVASADPMELTFVSNEDYAPYELSLIHI